MARLTAPLQRLLVTGALGAALLGAPARAAAGEVVVTDDAGTDQRFAAPVARLVTLAPHLTELLPSPSRWERAGRAAWADG